MLHRFARLATAALQRHDLHALLGFRRCREIHSPEILHGVQKSHAIGIDFALNADLADHAHFGLFVGIQAAEDQFLFSGKLVAGNNARSMPAEKHRFRLLGENLAFGVAAHQKDMHLLGNSAEAAHTLWGHWFTHSKRKA